MKYLFIVFLMSIIFYSCKSQDSTSQKIITKNTLDDKWSKYYESMYETADVAISYIDSLECHAQAVVEHIDNNVYKTRSKILKKEDEKMLLSIIQSIDTSAFITIRMPYMFNNTTLSYFIYSDKNFYRSFELNSKEEKFKTEWFEKNKGSYRLRAKKILIRQKEGDLLSKSRWASSSFQYQDTIKGVRLSYLEKLENLNSQIVEVIVYIPYQ